VKPELLGSQGPPALSKKVALHVMHADACRIVTPGAVAHSEVLADQQADGQCSCVRCEKCEPSIIYKEKSMRQYNFYGTKKLEYK
jgi:hypothetical protein